MWTDSPDSRSVSPLQQDTSDQRIALFCVFAVYSIAKVDFFMNRYLRFFCFFLFFGFPFGILVGILTMTPAFVSDNFNLIFKGMKSIGILESFSIGQILPSNIATYKEVILQKENGQQQHDNHNETNRKGVDLLHKNKSRIKAVGILVETPVSCFKTAYNSTSLS